MRYHLLCGLLLLVLAGCASPTQPAVLGCEVPPGPITFRVLINGHLSNRPLAGLPAQLRSGLCVRDALTNADGIAEWHVMAGTYTVAVRGVEEVVDRPVTQDVQWLFSFPE